MVGCTSSGHGELRREEMLESHELWLGTLVGSSLDEGYKLLAGGPFQMALFSMATFTCGGCLRPITQSIMG